MAFNGSWEQLHLNLVTSKKGADWLWDFKTDENCFQLEGWQDGRVKSAVRLLYKQTETWLFQKWHQWETLRSITARTGAQFEGAHTSLNNNFNTSISSREVLAHFTNYKMKAKKKESPKRKKKKETSSRREALVGWRQHELGWTRPLRNWNSFFFIFFWAFDWIALHCELAAPPKPSVCLCLSNSFSSTSKRPSAVKRASQHTERSPPHPQVPPGPGIQTRRCPPSHQFSSLI